MKRRMLLLALALWFPLAVAAEDSTTDKKKVEYHGVALVNRVEPVLGLLNITHGDVPFANWTTFTRDVRVWPRSLVQGLSPGMKIRFQLAVVDPTTYVITALEPIE